MKCERPSTLTLPDGRHLACEDAGSGTASPVFYCHGTPGSRLQRRLFVSDGNLGAGVRLITIHRPGPETDRQIAADSETRRGFLEMLRDCLRQNPRDLVLDRWHESGG